jgi:hypothetical protein
MEKMVLQPHAEEKVQEIRETLETITGQLLEFWWKLQPGLDRQKAINIIARALKHRGHTTKESPSRSGDPRSRAHPSPGARPPFMMANSTLPKPKVNHSHPASTNSMEPFRCDNCGVVFGWTNGVVLACATWSHNKRVTGRCAGCGKLKTWSPKKV